MCIRDSSIYIHAHSSSLAELFPGRSFERACLSHSTSLAPRAHSSGGDGDVVIVGGIGKGVNCLDPESKRKLTS